jgi:hypothetical protein
MTITGSVDHLDILLPHLTALTFANERPSGPTPWQRLRSRICRGEART